MSNRRLNRCPTCGHELDHKTRAAMGLRNGEVLNSLCPGAIGPSDIDNVLHNGRSKPERIMFLEYKNNGAPVPTGQAWLLRSLAGDWQEQTTGRLLAIRFDVLQQHPPDPEAVLQPVVDWLWG